MTTKIKFLFFLVLTFLLSGCWSQHDVVSVRSDGAISFESDVVIPASEDPEQVGNRVADFVRLLKANGWKVELQWVAGPRPKDSFVQRTEPYRLKVSGQANIHTIKSVPDQYIVQKLGEDAFKLVFVAVDSRSGGSFSREVELLVDGVTVVNASNEKVQKVGGKVPVAAGKAYRLLF